MKTRTARIVALFAATAITCVGAFAADIDKTPVDVTSAKMDPHTHMQEKTGIAPPATADAKNAASATDGKVPAEKKSNKKNHFHPRDGK